MTCRTSSGDQFNERGMHSRFLEYTGGQAKLVYCLLAVTLRTVRRQMNHNIMYVALSNVIRFSLHDCLPGRRLTMQFQMLRYHWITDTSLATWLRWSSATIPSNLQPPILTTHSTEPFRWGAQPQTWLICLC
ncbi:hypothetical protein FVEG_16488 [Fusarium verticillioides 7600]|uniref:Uncharacterized protein n=1 Tax=Gibberella moniliformis (strain M3125 / FGSC 7600) TaxID=334819 RepID=W7MEQ8_GIBM7|nr:hypothetical protein FVEG_16488 [Fusarium verticillioides 7600]XP_018755596.1 hypothetical protein FVEG_16488 [Fusarium verticillioides 7600]XP_018755597.1 hypothetical protein FVEG_16488 [Fusarium verticillioides 7600]EWG49404.1 hypothetical protein FVEG_16488 [Fusarium verticillioides 7600]EWG49405.1 hypothetical protein FVEG_16488 [Fusarium verticillioides 7600]EWG49406.1 hypothetical protein FVEG_16488 [Fusarium verticillioides 7600]